MIDAGKLGIPNARVFNEALVCAGQPHADGLQRARDTGISEVINLRPASEDPAFDTEQAARAIGLGYRALPLAGAADLSRSNVEKFDVLLREVEGHTTLVHCASGNRVGAMMALRAHWLQGKPVDEALQIGAAAGLTGMADKVKALLAG